MANIDYETFAKTPNRLIITKGARFQLFLELYGEITCRKSGTNSNASRTSRCGKDIVTLDFLHEKCAWTTRTAGNDGLWKWRYCSRTYQSLACNSILTTLDSCLHRLYAENEPRKPPRNNTNLTGAEESAHQEAASDVTYLIGMVNNINKYWRNFQLVRRLCHTSFFIISDEFVELSRRSNLSLSMAELVSIARFAAESPECISYLVTKPTSIVRPDME